METVSRFLERTGQVYTIGQQVPGGTYCPRFYVACPDVNLNQYFTRDEFGRETLIANVRFNPNASFSSYRYTVNTGIGGEACFPSLDEAELYLEGLYNIKIFDEQGHETQRFRPQYGWG